MKKSKLVLSAAGYNWPQLAEEVTGGEKSVWRGCEVKQHCVQCRQVNVWWMKLPVCTGTEGCSVSWLAVGSFSSTVVLTGNTNTHMFDYSGLCGCHGTYKIKNSNEVNRVSVLHNLNTA